MTEGREDEALRCGARPRAAARGRRRAACALLLASIAAAACSLPPRYVARVLFWGNADVGDSARFPARPVRAGAAPQRFRAPSDTAPARRVLEAAAGAADIGAFLDETGTQALLVVEKDALVYEGYASGASRETIVTSFSVAKSFTSALVGIALAKGHLRSAADPITVYLPELAQRDPRFSRITLRHLMTMSSGIRYVEFPFVNGDDAKTYYYPDLRSLALGKTVIAGPPGERWLYNNYNPLLMGMILERATGTSVARYLEAELWQPFGAEADGSWSLDSDETGFEKMESGINARAADFARFGKLLLDGGRRDGRQVIPEEWVAESTTTDPGGGRPDYYPDGDLLGSRAAGARGYYAYWWWGTRRGDGTHEFCAIGNFGQFIFVSPARGVVIARNGSRWGRPVRWWLDWFHEVARGIGEDDAASATRTSDAGPGDGASRARSGRRARG